MGRRDGRGRKERGNRLREKKEGDRKWGTLGAEGAGEGVGGIRRASKGGSREGGACK